MVILKSKISGLKCPLKNRVVSVKNYLLNDGTIYSGEVSLRTNYKKMIPNGTGKAVFKNNDIYIGQWFNGHKHGIGRLIKPQYSDYSGEFVKDNMHGFGKIIYHNKQIVSVEADWNNNTPRDMCCIIYNDRSKYCGFVRDSTCDLATRSDKDTFIKHGVGVYYFSENYYIKGTWKNNILQDNKCKIVYPNGSIYEGECNKDLHPHGHGKIRYVDGSVYMGFWNDGLRNGYGFLRLACGDYYNGYWKNDKKHYLGIFYSKIASHAIEFSWNLDTPLHIIRSYYY